MENQAQDPNAPQVAPGTPDVPQTAADVAPGQAVTQNTTGAALDVSATTTGQPEVAVTTAPQVENLAAQNVDVDPATLLPQPLDTTTMDHPAESTIQVIEDKIKLVFGEISDDFKKLFTELRNKL